MAGPYGDTTHIRHLLNQDDAPSASTVQRIDALNVAVSLVAEAELGRTFGETATDQTVLFWANNSDVLVLPRPIRTITSVIVGGTVAGSTMTGGTVYANSLWTPHPYVYENGEIPMLRLLSGGRWGSEYTPVQIIGQWANVDADASPPDDFVYAIDNLVAEHFKIEQASPAGFTGPDGSTVPIRNPWKSELWLKVKEKYSIAQRDLVL